MLTAFTMLFNNVEQPSIRVNVGLNVVSYDLQQCTRIVAGLLHICNVYPHNKEHCLSFQMRCLEKRTYLTNDYREQQKLLIQVEHLQHGKWEQNQVHLSLIPPPSPWRIGPHSCHGLPNFLRPILSISWNRLPTAYMEQGYCNLLHVVLPSAKWSSYWPFSSETSFCNPLGIR
jgi:hypothetical protein